MQYSVHKADLTTNKKDIIKFWATSFPEWPQEKFSWFYENNPCSRALCWIIKEAETNMVVGSVAVFPKRFFIHGKYIIGGMAGDLGVHKNIRVLGPALKLLKMKISAINKDSIDFFYNYPNKISQPALKRVGYKVLGNDQMFVKIFKSIDYVKRFIKNELIAKFVSKIIDIILKIISKEYYISQNNEYYSGIQIGFDKKFDDMWGRLTHQINLIVGERTSRILNWRFNECPYKQYYVFTLCRKLTNELSGYIIYEVEQENITIADIFTENIDIVFDILMSKFLLMNRKKQIKTIYFKYLGNKLIAKKLKSFNFFHKDLNVKVCIYSDSVKFPDDYFLNEENWYLTTGDKDF